MAIIEERVATLETRVEANAERVGALHDAIHGGPSCDWQQSVRGRLHAMQSAIEAADKLADATQALVREQNRLRQSRVKTWQWLLAAVIGIATAAAPYVVLLTQGG